MKGFSWESQTDRRAEINEEVFNEAVSGGKRSRQLSGCPQPAFSGDLDIDRVLPHAGGSQYATGMASREIAELGHPMPHWNIVVIQYGDIFAASMLKPN